MVGFRFIANLLSNSNTIVRTIECYSFSYTHAHTRHTFNSWWSPCKHASYELFSSYFCSRSFFFSFLYVCVSFFPSFCCLSFLSYSFVPVSSTCFRWSKQNPQRSRSRSVPRRPTTAAAPTRINAAEQRGGCIEATPRLVWTCWPPLDKKQRWLYCCWRLCNIG